MAADEGQAGPEQIVVVLVPVPVVEAATALVLLQESVEKAADQIACFGASGGFVDVFGCLDVQGLPSDVVLGGLAQRLFAVHLVAAGDEKGVVQRGEGGMARSAGPA
ncbi:hypothetical protein [Catellatospora sp. NPDC049133]|uniref:hypothetical protein n=1 Tax=Catellatospora sp. NPDC049133 TaxID=3155499 RepID=UPI003400BAD8